LWGEFTRCAGKASHRDRARTEFTEGTECKIARANNKENCYRD